MERIATFIKMIPSVSGTVQQRVYRLSEPLAPEQYDVDLGEYVPVDRGYDYIVVSSVIRHSGQPETYIFGADEDGKIVDWRELRGSSRGHLSHDLALSDAGYSPAYEVEPLPAL